MLGALSDISGVLLAVLAGCVFLASFFLMTAGRYLVPLVVSVALLLFSTFMHIVEGSPEDRFDYFHAFFAYAVVVLTILWAVELRLGHPVKIPTEADLPVLAPGCRSGCGSGCMSGCLTQVGCLGLVIAAVILSR